MKAIATIVALLVFIALALVGAVGWVLNLIHVIGYINSTAGDSFFEVISRVVGVFVFFIGAILGYI